MFDDLELSVLSKKWNNFFFNVRLNFFLMFSILLIYYYHFTHQSIYIFMLIFYYYYLSGDRTYQSSKGYLVYK